MRYYEVELEDERSWLLTPENRYSDGTQVVPGMFGVGRLLNLVSPVPFRKCHPGQEMDYNRSILGIEVVSQKMHNILTDISPNEIQLLPAFVDGVEGKWYVLNVTSVLNCIDFDRSLIQYYPADDPDSPGGICSILSLVIDPTKVVGYHIFKIPGWSAATIVSEYLARVFKDADVTGITSFQAVVEPWQK